MSYRSFIVVWFLAATLVATSAAAQPPPPPAPEHDATALAQPFVNYNFGKGWALAFAPLITANWDAPDGDQWTVPIGLGITRTTVFNGRPMSLGVQYYDNVERPAGSAGQQLKFVISFLYPRRP